MVSPVFMPVSTMNICVKTLSTHLFAWDLNAQHRIYFTCATGEKVDFQSLLMKHKRLESVKLT
jgi:hypothetical protein